jgi:hypothetical protein
MPRTTRRRIAPIFLRRATEIRYQSISSTLNFDLFIGREWSFAGRRDAGTNVYNTATWRAATLVAEEFASRGRNE